MIDCIESTIATLKISFHCQKEWIKQTIDASIGSISKSASGEALSDPSDMKYSNS